jgi:hypothetical protein
LYGYRYGYRICRMIKNSKKAVAGSIHFLTMMMPHRRANDRPVAFQHGSIALAQSLGNPCGAFHIGEKKRFPLFGEIVHGLKYGRKGSISGGLNEMLSKQTPD